MKPLDVLLHNIEPTIFMPNEDFKKLAQAETLAGPLKVKDLAMFAYVLTYYVVLWCICTVTMCNRIPVGYDRKQYDSMDIP